MIARKQAGYLVLLLLGCSIGKISSAPAPSSRLQKATAAHPAPRRADVIDDSLALPAARDLNLSIEGGHKAEALAISLKESIWRRTAKWKKLSKLIVRF